MEAKHTPGPWKAEKGTGVHDGWTVVTAPGMGSNTPLAKLSNVVDDADPDARLIAAAPDLLAALQDLIDTGFTGGPQGKRARDAVAKATGSNH